MWRESSSSSSSGDPTVQPSLSVTLLLITRAYSHHGRSTGQLHTGTSVWEATGVKLGHRGGKGRGEGMSGDLQIRRTTGSSCVWEPQGRVAQALPQPPPPPHGPPPSGPPTGEGPYPPRTSRSTTPRSTLHPPAPHGPPSIPAPRGPTPPGPPSTPPAPHGPPSTPAPRGPPPPGPPRSHYGRAEQTLPQLYQHSFTGPPSTQTPTRSVWVLRPTWGLTVSVYLCRGLPGTSYLS